MILSVHLADVGVPAAARMLRARPATAGLRYSELAITAPLGGGRLPAPNLGTVGLLAAWDDDAALDGFLADDPLARRLAGGWRVRLRPVRVVGAWPELPDLPRHDPDADADGPVAVLTLGRLRFRRLPSFLRTNQPAADHAIGDPALIAGTALARPPRLVATFSLWSGVPAMRRYVTEEDCGHSAAIRHHGADPFHHESAFVRFRPYGAQGSWDGFEPLGLSGAAAAGRGAG
jgi:hypothetical protein